MMWVRRLSALALVVFAACDQGGGATEIRPGGPIASATQEIQGGTLDNTSTNVVAILLMDGANVGICSGSLIAPNLVLTAHHCVAPSNTTACGSSGFGTTFAVGNFRITTSGTAAEQTLNAGQWPTINNTVWFGAAEVTVPTTPANNICGGDMALIRLSTNITNICPLIPRVDSAVAANEAYTAVGFGVTSPTGQTSGTRYTVSGVNVLCDSNCGAGTNGSLEWVGGSTAQRGVCEGDSGGPALDSQRRVLGTVSRGDPSSCNQALYESVFGQAAWIKSVAAQAATAGGYTAPAWVTGGPTSINGCTGVDGGTGGGAGGGTGGGSGGGAGGGAGGGSVGGGVGGGGGSTGTCSAGTVCQDATGAGDFACLTSAGDIPAGAPTCSMTVGCAIGFTCYGTSPTAGVCLQDCAGTPTGGGAGGGGVTGGGAGGGGGSSGGACTNPATSCVDASTMGDYACIDTNSTTGVPAGAPSCASAACPTNYSCWGTSGGNFCLQNCTLGATGGGAGGGGGPVGGGAGGGVPVGGGAGGGLPVGGGAGGGSPVGGGSGGAGGGTPVGGGTGGTGGAGGSGGSGGAAGGGTAGTGGGFNFPTLPDKPKPTGCGCTELPTASALWMMLSGLALLRRRR